jgi:hypothetical protein
MLTSTPTRLATTMSPLSTEPATLYSPKEAEAPDGADASHPSRAATSDDGGDDAGATRVALTSGLLVKSHTGRQLRTGTRPIVAVCAFVLGPSRRDGPDLFGNSRVPGRDSSSGRGDNSLPALVGLQHSFEGVHLGKTTRTQKI